MLKPTIHSIKIRNECIYLLFEQIKNSLWGSMLPLATFAVLMNGLANPRLLEAWVIFYFGLNCVSWVAMMVCFYLTHRNAQREVPIKSRWIVWYAFNTVCSGLTWGLVGAFFLVPDALSQARETLLTMCLLGAVTCGVIIFSPIVWMYALFAIPAFVPFILMLILRGGDYTVTGLLAIAYIVVLIIGAVYINYMTRRRFSLQWHNTDLLEDLSKAKLSLEEQREALQRSLSLVKATLDSTAEGIMVVDSENSISDLNKKFADLWGMQASELKNKNIYVWLQQISDELAEPDSLKKIIQTSQENHQVHFTEIKFLNGKVYACFSQPQIIGAECVGRVWSFRDVTDWKEHESLLIKKAHLDPLTELPNRAAFEARMAAAIIAANKGHQMVGVLFLDLDRFKIVNDTLGHEMGDQVLSATAKRLRECCQGTDLIVRLGSDEFVVLRSYVKDPLNMEHLAEMCLQSLSKPFKMGENVLTISCSIGISIFPRDGQNAEAILHHADKAMYAAKQAGRNRYKVFSRGEV